LEFQISFLFSKSFTNIFEKKKQLLCELYCIFQRHQSLGWDTSLNTSFDNASTPVNTPVLTNTSLDTSIPSEKDLEEIKQLNVTDEEKEQRLTLKSPLMPHQNQNIFEKKPFPETITNSLLCTENDYVTLFTLWLLYVLANN